MYSSLRDNWPLFVGIGMIMVGNGLLGTLLTIRGLEMGFSTPSIGLVQLGYPAGALLGTLFVPRVISRVGHIRAFSALASICSVTAIVHLMTTDIFSWFSMRLVAGVCFPGLYVITESWLNTKAKNTNRAQLLSVYFVAQSLGSAVGVSIAGLNDVSGAVLFGLVSIVLSLAIVPLLLSSSPAPSYSEPERMSLQGLFNKSPMALLGALLSGAVAGALFVGMPIYALATGASAAVASSVLALATLVGAAAFFPAGWISDRMDRRKVIAGLALGGFAVSAFETLVPGGLGLVVTFTLIAAFTTPIYAISLAHGNDLLRHSQIIPASGAMVFVQNIGILVGFALGPVTTEFLGGRGYPLMLTTFLGLLLAIAILRRQKTVAPLESGQARPAAGLIAPLTGNVQSASSGNQV